MTTTSIENHTLERLLDAWDTTVLPTHRDGAMQEWMEALRYEFTTCPDASITGLDPAPKAETDDRHRQELLAQDIAMANLKARHEQELCAYQITVDKLLAERDALLKDAERYRWLAAHARKTSEHWGGRWSIVIDGPAPKSHDSEDDFDEAIDAAIAKE